MVDLTKLSVGNDYIKLVIVQRKVMYFRKLWGIITAVCSDNHHGIVFIFLTVKKA